MSEDPVVRARNVYSSQRIRNAVLSDLLIVCSRFSSHIFRITRAATLLNSLVPELRVALVLAGRCSLRSVAQCRPQCVSANSNAYVSRSLVGGAAMG